MATSKQKIRKVKQEEYSDRRSKKERYNDNYIVDKKDKNKSDQKINTVDKKEKYVPEQKNSRILEVKTTQTGALKQVIERISSFISDCCIVFIPPDNDTDNVYDDCNSDIYKKNKISSESKKKSKKNSGGIRILRLTEDKSILVKLTLDAVHFEYFRCDEPKITIGVDMHALHQLLKSVNDDDPIMLYMLESNRNVLYIHTLNENKESSEQSDIEVYLIELNNQEMPIPSTDFDNIITMASDKFHQICKSLHNTSTYVEITAINNEISFQGKNEYGNIKMTCKDNNYNNKKKEISDQIVHGVYELRNLLGFSKCNKLCNTIDIYLKNDFPLVLVITVGGLGKMYVFLTPADINSNN